MFLHEATEPVGPHYVTEPSRYLSHVAGRNSEV
jgi:hypothetical protein